jgi:hypothetical protein
MIQNTYANLSSLTAEWAQPEFSVGDINILAVLAVLGALVVLEKLFGCRPKPRETIRQSYLTALVIVQPTDPQIISCRHPL